MSSGSRDRRWLRDSSRSQRKVRGSTNPQRGRAGGWAGRRGARRAGGGPPPPGPGGPEIAGGVFWSRYAGAMLLHAFTARAGAGQVLESAAGAGRGAGGYRFADVALLSVTSMCFALGAATIEQVKHLTASCAGPLAGLAVLPHLRTLRPALAGIADAADPLALQEMAARAMLAADPVTSSVYYVDDHFVPYAGAQPVAKGWNNKRGKAERGRADTHVTAHDGRAVCFVTGEPSGLSVTLPKALAELKKAAPPGAAIMLGSTGRGVCAGVPALPGAGRALVSYRRAPLAVPAMLPVITTITGGGRKREIAWAEEKVQLKDYGEARQLTLFEHGQVVLQVLTSDLDACPADILAWLKSRWREENFLKYASENYGIDKICDYIAGVETSTKIVDNPARKKANAAVREAEKAVAAAERDLAVLLADPAISPAAKNTRLIPAAQDKIAAAHKKLAAAAAARDTIPAKLPANLIDPEAQVALQRTCRRGLQMVLRLHAHNAEHWLASHLNAYLRDNDEYRAITRQTIIRGLPAPSPTPPTGSPWNSTGPARPASPAPWPCSSTRSTTPRPPCPATPVHHLPAHRTPARTKQITQNDYRRSEAGRLISSARRKVAPALEEWLDRIEHSVKPSMLQNWRDYAAYYVIPYIGQRDVQQIDGGVCDALYKKLLTEGRVKAKSATKSRKVPVHVRRLAPDGHVLPCRPHRYENARCHRQHAENDPVLGQPIESKKPSRRQVEITKERAERKVSPGLEPKTVANTHRMLHRAWQDFMAWGWAKRNVAKRRAPSACSP